MRERLRQEDGIALLLALGFSIVLSLLVFGMTSYVMSNQHNAQNSGASSLAGGYAEAALNTAYSTIVHANNTVGMNPTSATLLGCAAGSSGASDCTTPTPLCLSYTSACPSPYTATGGTATVYGYYTGTVGGTEAGVTAAASTWILVATGYARNASGKIDAKRLRATVAITAGGSGAVASVWNHVFMTAPYVPNVCQANFAGNNMVIDVPLYVIGNLCLSGQGVMVKEKVGGQAIDLQVGGKISLSGSGASVGDYSTSPVTPITSGVAVGGCTNGDVTTSTGACDNGSYRYKVASTGTFIPQSSPEETDTDMAADYAAFDPGPKHTCQSGVASPGPPLADTAFDNNLAASGEPDASGSGTAGGSFELAPSSSYSCISKSGASVGELTWNNATSTQGGVAAKTLKINGSIFIDGNLTISQSLTYTGTAVIEVAGTITFNGNATTVCAVNTGCVFSSWQGSTGHNDMLTLVSLKKNATSIVFTNNSQKFQGSLWTQPSSGLTFQKNGVDIQGPMAVGSFDATFNNATIEPLPVIKNMPVGAPVPPNVSATVQPLNMIG